MGWLNTSKVKLILFAVVVFGLGLALGLIGVDRILGWLTVSNVIYLLIALVLFGLGVWLVYIMTSRLPDELKDQTSEAGFGKVLAIVRAGYFSIFLVIFLSFLPFTVFEFAEIERSPSAPIQLVKGCRIVDLGQIDANNRSLPCDYNRAQWFLNIGASLGLVSDPTALIQASEDTVQRVNIAFTNPQDIPAPLAEDIRQLKESAGQLGHAVSQFKNQTGYTAAAAASVLPVISGGLVVPLYMVLIALVGGCVNMMRRMPEIQSRGSLGYWKEYAKYKEKTADLKVPLLPARVREYVIFQIMQVVSAPLIAITAFAIFDPKITGAIVSLGFVSGFASEAILLRIRKAADLVGGAKPAPPPPAGGDAAQETANVGAKPVAGQGDQDSSNADQTPQTAEGSQVTPGDAAKPQAAEEGQAPAGAEEASQTAEEGHDAAGAEKAQRTTEGGEESPDDATSPPAGNGEQDSPAADEKQQTGEEDQDTSGAVEETQTAEGGQDTSAAGERPQSGGGGN